MTADYGRPRRIDHRALATLARLLEERGLSSSQIDRGLAYAASTHDNRSTIRATFELAMSRHLYTDEELAAGHRFDAADGATDPVRPVQQARPVPAGPA